MPDDLGGQHGLRGEPGAQVLRDTGQVPEGLGSGGGQVRSGGDQVPEGLGSCGQVRLGGVRCGPTSALEYPASPSSGREGREGREEEGGGASWGE